MECLLQYYNLYLLHFSIRFSLSISKLFPFNVTEVSLLSLLMSTLTKLFTLKSIEEVELIVDAI